MDDIAKRGRKPANYGDDAPMTKQEQSVHPQVVDEAPKVTAPPVQPQRPAQDDIAAITAQIKAKEKEIADLKAKREKLVEAKHKEEQRRSAAFKPSALKRSREISEILRKSRDPNADAMTGQLRQLQRQVSSMAAQAQQKQQ